MGREGKGEGRGTRAPPHLCDEKGLVDDGIRSVERPLGKSREDLAARDLARDPPAARLTHPAEAPHPQRRCAHHCRTTEIPQFEPHAAPVRLDHELLWQDTDQLAWG